MAPKLCFILSFACFLLITSKSFGEAKISASPANAPTPPPPTTSTPPPSSRVCVVPCWQRCHDIKAKNIRPCMVLCTRCCFKCNYTAPPTCKNWDTVTIEGNTYKCP